MVCVCVRACVHSQSTIIWMNVYPNLLKIKINFMHLNNVNMKEDYINVSRIEVLLLFKKNA